jgi:minimal CRISPR polymerase domain/CRISPR-associated protein
VADNSTNTDLSAAQKQKLFAVVVPGVQRFIHASRKTADLAAASKIRDDLVWFLVGLLEQAGTEIIIPVGGSNAPAVTNRIVGRTNDDTILDELEAAAKQWWLRLVEETIEVDLLASHRDASGYDAAVIWSSVEYDPNQHRKCWDDLQSAVRAARRAMAFAAVNQTGSALCGQCARSQTVPVKGTFEPLCVSCSTKRLVGNNTRFPSTSTISAVTFLAAVLHATKQTENQNLANAVSTIMSIHDELGLPRALATGYDDPGERTTGSNRTTIDGAWWFDSSWDPVAIRREHPQVSVANLESNCVQARQALRILRRHVGEPAGSYAIVQLDGDGIGEALSGCNSLPDLQELATKMSNFAASVRATVESTFQGRLVYAGGDDVLAFAPVDNALGLFRTLHESFTNTVGKPISGSVHVVPRSAPLGRALRDTTEALAMAKNRSTRTLGIGKLAVRVTVGSGFRHLVAINTNQVAALDSLASYFSRGIISQRVIYDLRRKAQECDRVIQIGPVVHTNTRGLSSTFADHIVLYIIDRHCGAGSARIFELAHAIVESNPLIGLGQRRDDRRIATFSAVLDTAALLARGQTT